MTSVCYLIATLVVLLPLQWLLSRLWPILLPQSPGTFPSKGSAPRGVRLWQVYPPTEKDAETDVDIIAVHGLDTRSPDTWTWKSKAGGSDVNWLANRDMLPSRVGSARIFMCDWPSDLFEHSAYSQKTFDAFARLLLASIEARPGAARYGNRKERPILFIASCLGGIILMKALVIASPGYLSVRRAVHGIVFLATPFRGTSFHDVAKWAEPGLRTWAFVRGQNVSKLLDETKSTPELRKLVRDFTTLCQKDIQVSIAAFFETGNSSLPRKLVPWLPAILSQQKPLVDEGSATLDVMPDPLPLNRTHVLMNKFPGPADEDYNLVAGRIEKILNDIREGRVVERADAYIKNKHYTSTTLDIERISNETMSVEKCYINLVVVEHLAQKERQAEKEDASRFSLRGRLKLETPEKGLQIDMPRLFDPRRSDDVPVIVPRRILIRGQAGVGKSTLCKKIVHNFKAHGMWNDMFVRILWVPLRNLKTLATRECNLEGMFRQEYFSQAPEGAAFARELWKQLEADKYEKTLFILDGLDEVHDGLEKGSNMFNLLGFLLNMPAVIVTSRPHVSLPDGLKRTFDLELDTIGFHPDQVKSYVEKVFSDPETDKPDWESVNGLRSILDQHQLLQELVRIPIQLDALCFIWSDDNSSLKGGSSLESMTSIYQAIVGSLWKKDILALGKKSDGEPVAKTDLQGISPRQIEAFVPDEAFLLERLAFAGMVSDTIEFAGSRCVAILDRSPCTNTQILPAKTLPRLSFLRTSNRSSRDPIYHFLHLTFQEYFAARHFARQWKAEKPLFLGENDGSQSVMTFLALHKYDARYNIFWRFVTGLLCLEDRRSIQFLQMIDGEPHDLLGPVHQRLLMHCLSEVPPNEPAFSATRKRLEDQFAHLLAFECEFEGEPRLAREMEFPEAPLEKALQSISMAGRDILVQSLRHRPFIPPNVMRVVSSWLTNNTDTEITCDILSMLRPPLNNDVLGAVVARLEDEEPAVRFAAINALPKWPQLDNDILDAVMIRARFDQEEYVRDEAIDVLGRQPRLDRKFIEILVERLDMEGPYVQRRIITTLASLPKPAQDILHVILAQLKNQDLSVKGTAVKALGSWPQPNDKILHSIKALLRDHDWHVQRAVIEGLRHWPEPNNELFDVVAAQLQHENWLVRYEAAYALRGRSWLSHDALDAVRTRVQLKGEQDIIRIDGMIILMNQSPPYDGIVDLVTVWLRDDEMCVRNAVLNALQSWPQPSKEIVDLVVASLTESPDVKSAALQALQNWPQLGDTVLDAIAPCLEDESASVREAAAEVFQTRPRLKEDVMKIIVARLRDPLQEDRTGITRRALLGALKNSPLIDDHTLHMVTGLLAPHIDLHNRVKKAAADVFRTRPQPNDQIIRAIGAHLTNRDWAIREAALGVLGSWRQLGDEVLGAIVACLEDAEEDVQTAAFYALANQSSLPLMVLGPHLQSLYKISLRISFDEHVYWVTENGKHFIVVGSRKVCWGSEDDDSGRWLGPSADGAQALGLRDCARAWRESYGFVSKAYHERAL